jgi:hypothetical protein
MGSAYTSAFVVLDFETTYDASLHSFDDEANGTRQAQSLRQTSHAHEKPR